MYNSHTKQLTDLRSLVFSIFTDVHPSPQLMLEHFHYPKKKPHNNEQPAPTTPANVAISPGSH